MDIRETSPGLAAEYTRYLQACWRDGITPTPYWQWAQYMPAEEPDSPALEEAFRLAIKEHEKSKHQKVYATYRQYKIYRYQQECAQRRQAERDADRKALFYSN